jgi:hypothetical protein
MHEMWIDRHNLAHACLCLAVHALLEYDDLSAVATGRGLRLPTGLN